MKISKLPYYVSEDSSRC